ncbi:MULTISPECIES: cupin domain-containing protein [unclassified Brenneria]|uniref:1,2-dihydroxy-3-keto-5-methylthiopentene dioxygenase n=1 Tax=unclassified Brenneria TaxID=2634434 RepID=UPI0029C3C772|nr:MULTISPECIES: cupin domain-containing protein [unclassified Brenneria]MDX5629168.1 cupin domain-containing protein [Brenneria sp. L3-3Z]MDX5696307.1 cupin domain-containing protein [Brenneria sp. L4-2C]MEE3662823.1 cupin domain-containing protein [Brenneria sp. g21c3]
MTTLSIFQRPQTAQPVQQLTRFDEIAALLAGAGIQLERWPTDGISHDADSEALLAHFRADIERLKQQEGYTSSDVISLTPDHPQRQELREKFLHEHTHSEDEVRFFVHGSGTFFVPINDRVFRLTCEAGDLLRVPANTPHWFDSGEYPDFVAIRIFTNPAGWVGHFTGRETFH